MKSREHIEKARQLSRELKSYHRQYLSFPLRDLSAGELWEALQPHEDLSRRFREFLDNLYFDGIRSRFFGDFDPEKLIAPVAEDIAGRLDALANDLESKLRVRYECASAGGAEAAPC